MAAKQHLVEQADSQPKTGPFCEQETEEERVSKMRKEHGSILPIQFCATNRQSNLASLPWFSESTN